MDENKIKKEIDNITSSLYNLKAKNAKLRMDNLKTYRDEIYRGFVIYLHLSIEDILENLIIYKIKKNKVFEVKELIKSIKSEVTSKEIINWAARLNILTKDEYNKLLVLNSIRNKCSHDWILTIPQYKKTNGKRIKKPKVMYKGKNLFNKKIFFDVFLSDYSSIYLKYFNKYFDIKYGN